MDQGTRDEMIVRLVARPTRVAIDGPPAAGKTTLADELTVRSHNAVSATGTDQIAHRGGAVRHAAEHVAGGGGPCGPLTLVRPTLIVWLRCLGRKESPR
jgi:hypothetical protein